MCVGSPQGVVHQAVLGDLNTMGHGIARLSRLHCTDALRFLSLGSYEAEVWHACVLSQMDPDYARDSPPPDAGGLPAGPSNNTRACRQEPASSASTKEALAGGARRGGGSHDGPAAGSAGGAAGSSGRSAAGSDPGALCAPVNRPLRRWGVTEAVCRDVLNPGATCTAFDMC